MNPFAAFVLGLLIGWLVEWVIDWFYWRRKNAERQVDVDASNRNSRRVTELEEEVASYKNQLARLQQPAVPAAKKDELRIETPVPVRAPVVVHDHLEEIKGITPEMAQRLHEAGIKTFADLGALRPQRLKELFGMQEMQPGSEVEMVKQARLMSGMIKKVDDLEVIVGIGPVIARTLNSAGIFTFAELSSLTVSELRGIVGDRIQRLADEEQLLAQARQLAEDQNRGG